MYRNCKGRAQAAVAPGEGAEMGTKAHGDEK